LVEPQELVAAILVEEAPESGAFTNLCSLGLRILGGRFLPCLIFRLLGEFEEILGLAEGVDDFVFFFALQRLARVDLEPV